MARKYSGSPRTQEIGSSTKRHGGAPSLAPAACNQATSDSRDAVSMSNPAARRWPVMRHAVGGFSRSRRLKRRLVGEHDDVQPVIQVGGKLPTGEELA